MRHLTSLATLLLASACNRYDVFIVAGSEQQSFTNDADILFVVDNSASMSNEAIGLAENISAFIEVFAATDPPADPTLKDDVARFVDFVQDRTGNIDYQIGMTTTEVGADLGFLLGDDPVLTRTDANVPRKFNKNLLCDAACVLPEDVGGLDVSCPNGPVGGNCANNQAGAAEEPLEAVFMALCHAFGDSLTGEALDECAKSFWLWEVQGRYRDREDPDNAGAAPAVTYDPDSARNRNPQWLRRPDASGIRSVVVPIIITDEGDQSRRLEERTPQVDEYLRLFDLLGVRTSFAVVGPNDCSSLATDWGVSRLENIVQQTNGIYLDIAEPSTCNDADFAEVLSDVGQLLLGLADTFPLDQLPVPETLVVEVNGVQVSPAVAREDEQLQRTVYEDGWFYDAERNIVFLYGDAVPDLNAVVRIWYLPATSQPRDLPL